VIDKTDNDTPKRVEQQKHRKRCTADPELDTVNTATDVDESDDQSRSQALR
jgi:hypothetical protein